MATINELKELALHAAKGTAPANFSNENVNEALIGEMSGWCSSVAEFNRHKYDLFEIITETADEVVPAKVLSAIGQFAEIKNVPQGQKVVFKKRLGRERAKSFVTRVGLAGVYEAFRLDQSSYEVPVHAIGGAGMVDFERFLDGAESMVEVMDIIAEGMEEAVYKEVLAALNTAFTAVAMPAANRVSVNGWDAAKMAKLCANVKMYGNGAVIFATPEFITTMGADVIVNPVTSGTPVVSMADIDAIHNTGLIKIFRGTPVVEIPQSFVDESNTELVFPSDMAYVLPTNGEKVVKVVFEGNTQMLDRQDEDWTFEFRCYRKLGVAIHTLNNWGAYKNTALSTYSPIIAE